MIEPKVAPKRRRTGLMIWMIVSQFMMLGTLAIWLVVAGFSVMAFDAGVTPEAWAVVLIVWSYPILPIILIIAAWIAYAKYKAGLAVILSSLSFAPPILCVLLVVIADLAWFAQFSGITPVQVK